MSNALAAEPSAYLKSATHQPVQWLPWGDEAFRRAQAEQRPILLDIGAVWCHWCHVMDGESYEDAEVAAILNKEYVCVKVGRDERPDVDARYQRAVQALTGQGGWPLTAFLTPAGEVFYGGTYFPPEQNPYGRPGFLTLLRRLADAWRAGHAKLEQSARPIREDVAAALNGAKPRAIEPALLDAAADQVARLLDLRYGGLCAGGGYWPWTPDEARAVLDAAEFAVVERVFDVRLPGEMPHDHEKNVLWLREEPADEAERAQLRSAVRKLKAARDRRPAPYVDRTPYVNWNAMMAGAFLQAGAVLDRPECNTLALRVLERIWQESWSAARGMTHAVGRAEPHGLLDDHVQA